MNLLLELKKYSPPDVISFGEHEVNQSVLHGQVAMGVSASAITPEIEAPDSPVKGNDTSSGFPLQSADTKPNHSAALGGWAFGVSDYSKHKDAAAYVAMWLASIVSTLAGVPAAYGFARLKTRGMERLSLWILSNRMLPPIAVVIPLYLLLGQLGMLDTRIGLIIIYSAFNLPYVVWTMISFFEEIPIELDEAAALDGSTILGTLCRIMVPIAAPGIIATAIFAFILCWSEFLFAVIFTSSTAQTLPVAIASFVTDRGIEWGKMSAAGSVLIVPLTVLFYSIQRFLIRGLSFGAIAG